MSFLVLKKNKFFEYLEAFKSEEIGAYVSFFLHFLILLFFVGLPDFFESKPINISNIIPIEIIRVEDITSISENAGEKKTELKKEVIIKEKKFNSSDKQEIKKITIKDKPKVENKIVEKNLISKNDFIVKEKKITSSDSDKKKIIINEKNIESLKIKKIKPKPKPLIDSLKSNKGSAPEVKPKPKSLVNNKKVSVEVKPKSKSLVNNKKVPVEVKPKQEPETEVVITSILKDLRNEQISPKNEAKKDSEEEKIQKIDKPNEEASEESINLSISEIDLVLQQLSMCFIAPLGSEIDKSTFVKISAKILPNRRVIQNSIRIVDTNIDINNPFYGPLTRSSMNTFLNPDCVPLKLPEEKYDLWRNITLTFDYSIMKGD
jgi:hypothetical protein